MGLVAFSELCIFLNFSANAMLDLAPSIGETADCESRMTPDHQRLIVALLTEGGGFKLADRDWFLHLRAKSPPLFHWSDEQRWLSRPERKMKKNVSKRSEI